MAKNTTKLQSLTPRERQVYKLIIENNTSNAIALKLSISYETIKTHRKKIYRKLKVKNLLGLIDFHHKA